jgi:hypothetical protein
MKTGGVITLVFMTGCCGIARCESIGAVVSNAQIILASRQIPACSLQPPYEQKGFFATGARLEIVGSHESGMTQVRFHSVDGRLIEALCRNEDLTATTPPAASIKGIGSAAYNDRFWLEDAAGHDLALEQQSKLQIPLLIFFYADWNDECQFLWKELLDTQDFKNTARNVIKLKINPEHGKEEGKLANKYRLRKYPTTLVVDKSHAKPRPIDLFYWSFGRMKTPTLQYAMDSIMSMETNRRPWEAKAPAVTEP